MSPKEGDIIEFDGTEAIGHAQQGCRPALIVSVNAMQQTVGLAVVCAITTQGGEAAQARNELEVLVPPGLGATGVILPHQMRTIDLKARAASTSGTVPRATLQAVRARLKILLGT